MSMAVWLHSYSACSTKHLVSLPPAAWPTTALSTCPLPPSSPALAELAVRVRPGLRVLTGIARAERWPELRPSALEVVLGLARSLAAYVVIDCAFGLERDEELSYDTVAPRRNGATLAALDAADTVVAVAAGDPVGLQRYVRALAELAEILPGCTQVTVVNRV